MADEITTNEPVAPGVEARPEITVIRTQAHRYLLARYGGSYVYRAPETFGNALERWIWAVASDSAELAEESIAAIEQHFAEAGR